MLSIVWDNIAIWTLVQFHSPSPSRTIVNLFAHLKLVVCLFELSCLFVCLFEFILVFW